MWPVIYRRMYKGLCQIVNENTSTQWSFHVVHMYAQLYNDKDVSHSNNTYI